MWYRAETLVWALRAWSETGSSTGEGAEHHTSNSPFPSTLLPASVLQPITKPWHTLQSLPAHRPTVKNRNCRFITKGPWTAAECCRLHNRTSSSSSASFGCSSAAYTCLVFWSRTKKYGFPPTIRRVCKDKGKNTPIDVFNVSIWNNVFAAGI